MLFQKRATKIIKELEQLYEEKLQYLGHFNLEGRKMRCTKPCMLWMQWKSEIYLPLSQNTGIRNHPVKLNPEMIRRDKRKYVLAHHAIKPWLLLPYNIMLATSLAALTSSDY